MPIPPQDDQVSGLVAVGYQEAGPVPPCGDARAGEGLFEARRVDGESCGITSFARSDPGSCLEDLEERSGSLPGGVGGEGLGDFRGMTGKRRLLPSG